MIAFRNARRLLRLGVLPVFLCLLAGCLGRPSLQEARKELSESLDPAVEAALHDADVDPRRFQGTRQCSDPLVGPSEGVRPYLTYRVPTSVLGHDPKKFVFEAEQVWEKAGLEIVSE